MGRFDVKVVVITGGNSEIGLAEAEIAKIVAPTKKVWSARQPGRNSRSKGLFAGISLNGAVLHAHRSGEQAIYGHEVTREEILGEEWRYLGLVTA